MPPQLYDPWYATSLSELNSQKRASYFLFHIKLCPNSPVNVYGGLMVAIAIEGSSSTINKHV
jgi:hypothetical protein